jgi:membrane-bound lytic murein transglycosylase D
MQYKVILLPVLVLLCNSTVANAQKKGSKIRVYYSAAPGNSKDTFKVAPPTVAKTITKSATPLLADNITASEKPAAPLEYSPATPPPAPTPPVNNIVEPVVVAEVEKPELDTSIKPKYGPVPLAGTKSYFGEKNTYVNDYVRRYLEVHNRTLTSVQSSSTKPFNVIDDVLEKKQLPKELKYLAVIESALNHKAVSRAGAVGPWQLMESTARMMGLTVNRKKDDRTDWYKSTAAATKYLELLYSQWNDWLLVIAAYNSGPVPVQRAIDRTGSHNFWDIKEYLPRETQGHVLAFIATASIFENLSKFINLGSIPVDFKFGKDEDPLLLAKKELLTAKTEIPTAGTAVVAAKTISPKSPYTDDELKHMAIVRITDPIHLGLMAQELGIDKKLLTRWNGDYDMFVMKSYPTPFYNLRLPKDKLDAFLSKKDKLTHKSEGIFSQIGKQ